MKLHSSRFTFHSSSDLWAQSLFDKSIEKTCMRALSKKRDDRHRTARHFAGELSRWLGEEPAPRPRGCLGLFGKS